MHLLEPMAAAKDCSFFVGAEGAPNCSNCLAKVNVNGSGHMDTCPCSGQTPSDAVATATADEVEMFKYDTLVVGTCYRYAEYTREDRGHYFYWSEPEYVGAFDSKNETNGSITYIFKDNGKENTIIVTGSTCFQVTQ
jgi:hypothetical protein